MIKKYIAKVNWVSILKNQCELSLLSLEHLSFYNVFFMFTFSLLFQSHIKCKIHGKHGMNEFRKSEATRLCPVLLVNGVHDGNIMKTDPKVAHRQIGCHISLCADPDHWSHKALLGGKAGCKKHDCQ